MVTRNSIHSTDLRFVRNVVVKALILFVVANLAFALWHPMTSLGRASAYNRLFPGRQRLPYGDNPERAYNLSLYNLEAMFASHELASSPKPANEYRVILIGDSSTWGFLLPAEHTLSAYLNAAGDRLPDGRRVRAYNLGYPVMSLTKDLLMLSYAKRYKPDLIVWPLTLESFPSNKQLFPPLLQNNPKPVRALIEAYDLDLDPQDPGFVETTFWERTIVGARRSLADLVRLQLYGVMWAATRIDQDIPETYTPRMEDLPADQGFHDLQPPHLNASDLALDVLTAGVALAGETPILFINEPMFVSQGENSHIRYNFFYPRWAYDDYRELMLETSSANGWHYQDMWDVVEGTEFTNSAVHLTPAGTNQFAQQLAQLILELAQESTED
jgi:hypothetical protein